MEDVFDLSSIGDYVIAVIRSRRKGVGKEVWKIEGER